MSNYMVPVRLTPHLVIPVGIASRLKCSCLAFKYGAVPSQVQARLYSELIPFTKISTFFGGKTKYQWSITEVMTWFRRWCASAESDRIVQYSKFHETAERFHLFQAEGEYLRHHKFASLLFHEPYCLLKNFTIMNLSEIVMAVESWRSVVWIHQENDHCNGSYEDGQKGGQEGGSVGGSGQEDEEDGDSLFCVLMQQLAVMYEECQLSCSYVDSVSTRKKLLNKTTEFDMWCDYLTIAYDE